MLTSRYLLHTHVLSVCHLLFWASINFDLASMLKSNLKSNVKAKLTNDVVSVTQ